MKPRTLPDLVIYLIICAAIYGVGAFCHLTLDCRAWSEATRIWTGCVWALVTAIAAIVATLPADERKRVD